MMFSFTMPLITLREAERLDANRIQDGVWDNGDRPWEDDLGLWVAGERVTHVLVLGGADSEAVIPVFEPIDESDKPSALATAQRYFETLLAETLTAHAIQEHL